MHESKTKIIPAKQLEELRNESREIEVDVVFDDDEERASAGHGAAAEGEPGVEAEQGAPEANDRTAEHRALDERFARAGGADEEVNADGEADANGETDAEEAGDEATLDDAHAIAAMPEDTAPADAEAAITAPSLDDTDEGPSPAATDPTGVAPASQSAPDAALLPSSAPLSAGPGMSPSTSAPALGSTPPRSRPGSSPHFPSTGPVAPISPIGSGTVPRPGPPRPSAPAKKT